MANMQNMNKDTALRLAQECADYATSLRSAANVAKLEGRAPPVSFLRAADLFERAASRITELESQLAQRFDAADMATAAAQGFRDGVSSVSAGSEPVAWRLRNTAFRSEVYEYFKTKYLAECRQKQFNAAVDDGGLHDLTPLYAHPSIQRTERTNMTQDTNTASGAADLPEALTVAVDCWFAKNTGLGGCSDKDVRELADIFRIHALAALASTPEQPVDAASQTIPSEWLEQAFRDGWSMCRDAEFIGEEAETEAFGNSTTNSRMIDAQQQPVAELSYEHQRAIMEGERNASLDAYSRVIYLTGAESQLYEAGFTNGWQRASHGQAPAGAYTDSTPHLKVGDSSFESWYAGYVKEGTKGLKQHCRDAYAAGMGDPLVVAAPTPQADTQPAPVLWLSPEQFANFVDADEAPFGKYIPARKTSAGKFTMPLFAARAPAPAQPVAEPVAYLTRTEEGDPAMLFLDRKEASMYCEDGHEPEPLYTAPPTQTQAVPLTSRQINDARCADLDPDDRPEPWAFTQGVRAAEKHHSIKGGQHGTDT